MTSWAHRSKYWILDRDTHQVKNVGFDEWLHSAPRFEDVEYRRVAYSQIDSDIYVSTVFLDIDHNFHPKGPPLLFETMIFGGSEDQYQDRYATWDEAEAGHTRAVALALGETVR